MIVLNVTYKCKPGLREKFLEAILRKGIDIASRLEQGNLKYDYYLPFDGSGDELLLVEHWRDAGALAAHGKTPHFCGSGSLRRHTWMKHGLSGSRPRNRTERKTA